MRYSGGPEETKAQRETWVYPELQAEMEKMVPLALPAYLELAETLLLNMIHPSQETLDQDQWV